MGGVILLLLIYCLDVLPNNILFDSSSCIFYALGVGIGIHYPKLMFRQWSRRFCIVALATFIMSISIVHLMCIELLNIDCKLFDLLMQVMRLTAAISFWIFTDSFISSIPDRKYFNYSFWVYAMHINVGAIVAKLLYIALPKNPIFSIVNFMVTVPLTLIIINYAASLLHLYLPKLSSILSGGR